jgi:hypothetical protein
MTGPARACAPAAQVVVMAKYPTVGAVKTRLAAEIGADAACGLHRAFVLDLAARLEESGLPVTWAFWPPDSPFPPLVAPAPCIAQAGGDLGARMEAAIRTCFAARPLPVLVIGVDSPHLDLRLLHEAAAALRTDCDVALGPALDGGYYLIGLRTPDPTPFTGVPWGTGVVLEKTLGRLRAAGRRVRLLPPTFDVDDGEGLRALRALVEHGAVRLPHTCAALAALPAVVAPAR